MVAPILADTGERDLARVWLRKVIGPILDGLANERVRLERGNIGFRAVDRRLEHVVPIDEMVAVSQRPNLEQFLRLQDSGQNLGPAIITHDMVVTEMQKAAATAFDKLTASPDFLALTSAVPTKQRALAEYVVSGIERLPDYYELFADWEQLGDRLRGLRTLEPLRANFDRLEELRSSLARNVKGLEERLRDLRDYLADSHRLPVIDQDIL